MSILARIKQDEGMQDQQEGIAHSTHPHLAYGVMVVYSTLGKVNNSGVSYSRLFVCACMYNVCTMYMYVCVETVELGFLVVRCPQVIGS